MSAVFDAYAEYYDLLYRDKDYPAEARYVYSVLTRHAPQTGAVLELGCGTGAHAEQLARLGCSVYGIDVSPHMVQCAKRREQSAPSGLLHFEAGDARTARLDKVFDSVVSLFHVVSYQCSNDDLVAIFRTASAHLKPGGLFVFDCWYGPGVLTDPPAVRVKRLEDRELTMTRIAEPTLDPNRNTVDVRYTLFATDRSSGASRQVTEVHRMRYLFLPELELMLSAAGLRMASAERWLSGQLDTTCWQAVITAVRPATQS